MKNYGKFKRSLEKNNEKIDNANKECENIEVKAEDIEKVLEKLKPLPFNKNNKQISNEDIRMVDDFAENVKKSIKSFKSMTKLKSTMEEIESTYQNLKSENREWSRPQPLPSAAFFFSSPSPPSARQEGIKYGALSDNSPVGQPTAETKQSCKVPLPKD